ncbi:hypothetical protein [Streptomyces lydicus]|uniref:hypothetical protein n=1 Tax=Streptomyces lydicus TaxID=47763 RepID=UPI001010610E|nr:hypothetical protein [Streptomyces lydicus]MCZ1009180.1 hypothetical protein [Streptomyces lydicus]
MDDGNLKAREIEKVMDGTEKTSREIRDLIGLKAKVTDPGSYDTPCSGHPGGNVHRAVHPWSVYDAPVDDMRMAMDRLRGDLPKHSWKIVKDGHDGSPSKAPQIVANHEGGEFSVDIRLHDERKYGNRPPLIEVTVESACFRAKKPD